MPTTTPETIRERIQAGEWAKPTIASAAGYVQADLITLHLPLALQFVSFCVRNPLACPLVDVLEPGHSESDLAPGADVRRALPAYRAYHNGALLEELSCQSDYWAEDMAHILLESDSRLDTLLARAGLPQNHVEKNVLAAVYATHIECRRAGIFGGPMVVTMRPIPEERVDAICQRLRETNLPFLKPVHIGAPDQIGIRDLTYPDWGQPLPLEADETPVFWASSLTSLAAIHASRPPLALANKPGHRLITDLLIA